MRPRWLLVIWALSSIAAFAVRHLTQQASVDGDPPYEDRAPRINPSPLSGANVQPGSDSRAVFRSIDLKTLRASTVEEIVDWLASCNTRAEQLDAMAQVERALADERPDDLFDIWLRSRGRLDDRGTNGWIVALLTKHASLTVTKLGEASIPIVEVIGPNTRSFDSGTMTALFDKWNDSAGKYKTTRSRSNELTAWFGCAGFRNRALRHKVVENLMKEPLTVTQLKWFASSLDLTGDHELLTKLADRQSGMRQSLVLASSSTTVEKLFVESSPHDALRGIDDAAESAAMALHMRQQLSVRAGLSDSTGWKSVEYALAAASLFSPEVAREQFLDKGLLINPESQASKAVKRVKSEGTAWVKRAVQESELTETQGRFLTELSGFFNTGN